MLMPKRVKRRKVHRGRMKGVARRGNFLAYGDYGLVAEEPAWITNHNNHKIHRIQTILIVISV